MSGVSEDFNGSSRRLCYDADYDYDVSHVNLGRHIDLTSPMVPQVIIELQIWALQKLGLLLLSKLFGLL